MSARCFADCAERVRRHDPDRYFSSLFGRPESRHFLHALYAFNHELARVAESVAEPALGEIRLAWWRDSLEQARQGRTSRHEVLEAMAAVFASCALPAEIFSQMFEARMLDLQPRPFADYAGLEAYLDATSGNLMRLAARILDKDAKSEPLAERAGIAFGLAGIARSIPFHARRGKSFIPASVLEAHHITPETMLDSRHRPILVAIMRELLSRAESRLVSARRERPDTRSFAAFLPAALVPLYAKASRARDFDACNPALAPHRRLLKLLSAAARQRI
ncbi:MAG: squalene/phytoene synthase family protein [Alphaproteobacteria bacterium]|nr:squalene/phytoene synthase family protein [Alphaproteobacteria bacterium]